MAGNEWLPLLNYSSKYNISLSTLRRRIKAETIPFKLEHGKYYLLDESEDGSKSPSKIAAVKEKPTGSHHQNQMVHKEQSSMMETPALASHSYVEASVLTSANRLVEEIKAAYAKILQEKEEQIAQLKEQMVDLKMLVTILEGRAEQDQRQQQTQPSPQPESSGQGQGSEEFFFSDFQNRDI